MNILIYGNRTSSRVKTTRLAVNSMLKYLGVSEYFNVNTVLSADLLEQDWQRNTKLIIMPGAYRYGEDLGKDALENIREFVRTGGSCLGLCAGAYTPCKQTIYRSKFTKFEGDGKLNLFQVHAKGSVYKNTCFHTTKNSRMVPVTYFDQSLSTKSELFALYNGGPEFIANADFTDFETIANYKDYPHKKAIISKELGSGRVLLSGVYPILNIEYIDEREYCDRQRELMQMYRGDQRQLWIIFLKYLLNVDSVVHQSYAWKRSRDSYDS